MQHLDARQRLALEPFEKGAARGRHVGEAAGDAGHVERRHRVAAAGNTDKLAAAGEFRRRFRDLDRCRCRTAPSRRRRTGRSRPASWCAPAPRSTCSTLRGPISRIMSSAPTSSTRRTRDGACAANFCATTASTGSTISRLSDFALARMSRAVGDQIVLAQRFADRPCPARPGTCSPCRRR